jgi:HAMP domain-containing protein
MISLVTVSIAVPSIIGLNTFTRSLEAEITEELEINALNAMDKLSRLMFERVADIGFLTDPGNFVISSSDNNFTIDKKLEYLRKIETTNKAYASISLYNNTGIKIGDTRSLNLGVNSSDEPFYRNAIDGYIYYDPFPIFSRSLRQYVIHFSGPLYDIQNNQTMGVLALTFPLNKINDIMREAAGTISGDVNIDLISDDGLLIYSNNDQKSVLQKKVTGLAIFDKLRNSTNRIETDLGSNSDEHGAGQTIFIGAKEPGFLDYGGNNWSLILAVDTEDAFKSVTLLRNQFIIIAVIILIISIISIFIFARTLSRPITKLRDITNEVSRGNFSTKIDIPKGAGDELTQLSSSFENMRQNIVNKREEILKANEELRQKDRLKDEFINIAAHELRTPIQPILGLCEVLRNKIEGRKCHDFAP